MELKLITSDDGSHTLFVPELNENYHSTYGAASESMHVYIANGLNAINKTNVTILEVGFGTGLNALLTLLNKRQKTIYYIAVEKFPLTMANNWEAKPQHYSTHCIWPTGTSRWQWPQTSPSTK